MPKKGTGRHTRDEWKRPTDDMRVSKAKRFTLSPEVVKRLDRESDGTRSGHVDAALRLWFHLQPNEAAPPRPKPPA